MGGKEHLGRELMPENWLVFFLLGFLSQTVVGYVFTALRFGFHAIVGLSGSVLEEQKLFFWTVEN